jgi:hypothetical protein
MHEHFGPVRLRAASRWIVTIAFFLIQIFEHRPDLRELDVAPVFSSANRVQDVFPCRAQSRSTVKSAVCVRIDVARFRSSSRRRRRYAFCVCWSFRNPRGGLLFDLGQFFRQAGFVKAPPRRQRG